MTIEKIDNVFIFVVCGEKKHINTLHYSINFLKHFSKYPIKVVTDSSRNEIEIVFDTIIDIKTPENLDNHQASIWLKTSLHKILPKGPVYCYLDTDVIALNKECNSVFKEFCSPIVFASDHCPINQFSPYAVNCDCKNKSEIKKEELQKLIYKYNPYANGITDEKTSRELFRIVNKIKSNPLKNLIKIIQLFVIIYISPNKKRIFQLNKNIRFDKSKKLWINSQNNPILYQAINYYKKIENESLFSYKYLNSTWLDENKKNVYNPECNHLIDFISNKFKVTINDDKWRHWNGGVFIFNETSNDFMDTWHNYTNEIFKDKNWITRDQGTLIATVWKYNLQNHKRLPLKFNFIADYYNPNFTYSNELGFTPDNFKTIIEPSLIHIYHNFGYKGWEIWDKVEEIKMTNSIP